MSETNIPDFSTSEVSSREGRGDYCSIRKRTNNNTGETEITYNDGQGGVAREKLDVKGNVIYRSSNCEKIKAYCEGKLGKLDHQDLETNPDFFPPQKTRVHRFGAEPTRYFSAPKRTRTYNRYGTKPIAYSYSSMNARSNENNDYFKQNRWLSFDFFNNNWPFPQMEYIESRSTNHYTGETTVRRTYNPQEEDYRDMERNIRKATEIFNRILFEIKNRQPWSPFF